MFKRADGIVDFDKSICIGCKACMAACPYDAIFINPEDHSAEKCNFCAHRIDMQLEPACVVVCPTQAILVGDMNDADSYVAQIVNRDTVAVRRPEKETLPKLFYKGAHQATLDPLAAKRPEGGLFMWSEQQEGAGFVTSGNPNFNNSSASRTTVDQNGNVWATNRAGNSVVHIGLVENGQCVDRNGNGVIDTSTAANNIRPWTNTGGVNTNGGVSTAQDECILHYTRVNSFGTRHVSVNKDNDIWVSGTSGRRFDLLDGITGTIKICRGLIRNGHLPAKCSIRFPVNRSSVPYRAR